MKKKEIYLLSPLKKEGTIFFPMIEFTILEESVDLSSCDTLMFTSKQAVVSLNEIDKSWKNYPSIAIGKATKSKIEELGGIVIYSPKKFYGKELAKDIKKSFRDRKILYIRPEIVSFDSKGYLSRAGVELKEQIIYRTSCKDYPIYKKPSKNAIIIFTSPSTIHCFFKNFDWDSTYIAVLIGDATREHLPNYCDYIVADEPLIDACIRKARELE